MKKLLVVIIVFLFLSGCNKSHENIAVQYRERDRYIFSEDNYFGAHLILEYEVHREKKRYIVEDEKELALLIYYHYLNHEKVTEFIIRGGKYNIDYIYLYVYTLIPDRFMLYQSNQDNYSTIELELMTEFDMEELSRVSDEILSNIPKNASDREKVKYIHDHIIRTAEYDNLAINDLSGGRLYNDASHPYAIIINKKGLCVGYSMAMNYLLDKLSIPSIMVMSYADNHVWNLIYIEDTWYQLDATWNDPIPDVRNRIIYTYFLKPAASGYFVDHKYDKLSDYTLDLQAYLEFGNWLLDIE